MSNLHRIRKRLALSQAAFAEAVGVTQSNVSHIEQGRQEVTPALARRVIAAARERGVEVSFDDIYGEPGCGGAGVETEGQEAA